VEREVADEILQDFANNARQWSETNDGASGTPGDEKLVVRFEDYPHLNDAKSREENRPVFEMKPYIRIMVPGDKDMVVHRPVREGDKTRFARAYLQFQAGQSQVQGTPLSEWPKVTRAQVEELKYFNIRTIEELANASDANIQRFAGVNQLRADARQHLKLLQEAEPLNRMQAELATRDETIAAMQAQIAALSARRQLEDQTPAAVEAAPPVPSKGK